MDGEKNASAEKPAYVEPTPMKNSRRARIRTTCLIFIFAFGGALFTSVPIASAATREELGSKIGQLKTTVSSTTALAMRTSEIINFLIATPQTMVLGTSVCPSGGSCEVGVLVRAGATPIASLQGDFTLPPGVSFKSVSAGSAATAAGKNAQGAATATGVRVLVAGLNQTPIESGLVAKVKLDIASTVPKGSYVLVLSGLVAATPAGTTTTLSGKSGLILVK